MSKTNMQIFDTPSGKQFNRQVASYARYMSDSVLKFPQLIEEVKKDVGIDIACMQKYSVIMRWGIRQLEYSFIFDNLKMSHDLFVLDIGSGVTILPNVLSKMGCKVDALDPDPNWELASAEVSERYNAFYSSRVNYINDYIYSIQGNGIYDRIISVSVLEHLPRHELKRILEKIIDLLKPGGRLILTVDYCPRVAFYHTWVRSHLEDKSLTFRIIRKLLTATNAIDIETFMSGFSYDDFREFIYPYISTAVDILELKERDKRATSYRKFWSSHYFEGCIHKKLRNYLSLGISWDKPF